MTSTKEQILTAAQALCQKVGHFGFSFRDLAAELGIRSASVHHHYPTKEELLKAMFQRYRSGFQERLATIEREHSRPVEMLRAFLSTLRDTLSCDRRVCLCGMLAAESESLSDEMRGEVRAFFDSGSAWVAQVLERGRLAGEFNFNGDAKAAALALVASLQGLLISARLLGGGQDQFKDLADWLIESLVIKHSACA